MKSFSMIILAKYTYTTSDCFEYGDKMKMENLIYNFDPVFYTTANRCLLDQKCRGFKYSFDGHYALCHTIIPRPNDSTWEPYQQFYITFSLDSGLSKSMLI